MNTHHTHSAVDSHCDLCARDVHAKRPSKAWRLAIGLSVVAMIAMILFGVMVGWAAIGVTVLAPLVFFTGIFLLGPIANLATAPPVCPECGCPVREFDTAEPSRSLAVSAPRSRRERSASVPRVSRVGA